MNIVSILRLLLSMLGHMCTLCLYHIQYIYLNVFGIFLRGPQKVTVPTVRITVKHNNFLLDVKNFLVSYEFPKEIIPHEMLE